jgi:hypothetical protein
MRRIPVRLLGYATWNRFLHPVIPVNPPHRDVALPVVQRNQHPVQMRAVVRSSPAIVSLLLQVRRKMVAAV